MRSITGKFKKLFGETSESEKRYSPAQCIRCKRQELIGYPDAKYISTSYVERHNLSVRMTNRRYTRLTNAFSKKIENHSAAVALGYFAYNFIKIHRTLRVTPAMATGVTDRLWEVSDLVALIEAEERGLERAASLRTACLRSVSIRVGTGKIDGGCTDFWSCSYLPFQCWHRKRLSRRPSLL
jgi:hypothetical protein